MNEQIESGFVDEGGGIWFGTKNGASRFDGNIWKRSPGRHFTDMEVNVVLQDAAGDMWFGTGSNGIHRFDGSRWRTYSASEELTSNQILDGLVDRGGDLWFATDGGGLNRFDGGGLNRFDGSDWTSYTTADGLPGNAVEAIMQDRSGKIWIGTDGNGVGYFDGNGWMSYRKSDGLASNRVEDLLEDRAGYIWFGTDGGGLSRFEIQEWISYTTADGLAFNKVKDLLQDPDGNMWFATDGGGVSLLSENVWTTYTTADGLTHNEVEMLMLDSSGHLWFGTEGGGASRFDGHRWTTYSEAEGLPHDEVEWIVEDNSGNIWFATDGGGVCRFDGVEFTRFTSADGLANDEVKAMLQDRHGDMWFATENGVSRFDGVNWLTYGVEDGFLRHRIEIIHEDNVGNIWLGSQGGLMRFDGDRWSVLTVEQGLVSNEIKGIYEDRRGHLWFGTSGGVSRYDGTNWSNYTTADGLVSNEVRKTLQDREGRFWFATLNGLSRFTPRATPSPQVTVEAVVVDRRYEGATGLEIPDDERLVTFEFSARGGASSLPAAGFRYRLVGYDEDWTSTRNGRAEYLDLPRGAYTFEVQAVDRDLVYSANPATVQLLVRINYLSTAIWILLILGVLAIAVQTGRVFRRESVLRGLHAQLQRSNEDLEVRVQERTSELQTVNEQLQSEISERQRVEQGMRQAQKMDAIGQLAAGVAHNFNNVLQAITGNIELAQFKVGLGDDGPGTLRSYHGEALRSAGLAADVVRQLMLVARSEDDNREHVAVDLRQVIVNVMALCRRTFDRKIDLQRYWPETVPSVNGDPQHLEQVILNLCLNARDAFPGLQRNDWRVTIRLETRDFSFDQLPGHPDLRPGVYGCILVEDNGMGMDNYTQERIFEPFFTTKEVGKGTGLGLSNAYAIVREHGGWIDCASEPGVGTSFSIYLPAVAQQGSLQTAAEIRPLKGGSESLMVVDDEDVIRFTVGQFLGGIGYAVCEAADGHECLEQLRREPVDLVLLDISMPKMSGTEVLTSMRTEFPGVRVIVFTGYAAQYEDFVGAHDVVQKPVNMNELAGTVREVLDAG